MKLDKYHWLLLGALIILVVLAIFLFYASFQFFVDVEGYRHAWSQCMMRERAG